MNYDKHDKGTIATPQERKSGNHPIIELIAELIHKPTKSPEWFPFCEQAISSIYSFAEHPDLICGKIIKEFAGELFNVSTCSQSEMDNISKVFATTMDLGREEPVAPETISRSNGLNKFRLSQLVFLVGNVAIKQIVHLEAIESEWKRRKSVKDSDANLGLRGDLDMVTASAEDEFTDRVALVRDRELLYGPKSLLAAFAPMVLYICTNSLKLDVLLQLI